jgi:hypothetical protein
MISLQGSGSSVHLSRESQGIEDTMSGIASNYPFSQLRVQDHHFLKNGPESPMRSSGRRGQTTIK